MKPRRLTYTAILSILFIASCGYGNYEQFYRDNDRQERVRRTTINRRITIDSDSEVNGRLSSVNGSIDIGEKARVRSIGTVNGSIRIRRDATVRGDVGSVNGSIRISNDVRVRGKVGTVNGSISTYSGVTVRESIETVNGTVNLEKTTVMRDITTYNGHIKLLDESIVRGDIIVKENRGWSNRKRHLSIEITDGSTVEGDIIVRDDEIEVTVYLSRGGKVNGRIRNAEVVRR